MLFCKGYGPTQSYKSQRKEYVRGCKSVTHGAIPPLNGVRVRSSAIRRNKPECFQVLGTPDVRSVLFKVSLIEECLDQHSVRIIDRGGPKAPLAICNRRCAKNITLKKRVLTKLLLSRELRRQTPDCREESTRI